MHRSLLKWFPLFGLCLPVSSVSDFRPDTVRPRWSLVQVRWFIPAAGRAGRCRQISLCVGSTHSVPGTVGLPHSRLCALPVYAAQAPSCSIWSGPCVACGSSFPVFHKSADWHAPAFCAFPARAAQAARSLTGALSRCGAPSPLRRPSLSFRLRQSGACTLCLAATLPADVDHPEFQEVFRGLFAVR